MDLGTKKKQREEMSQFQCSHQKWKSSTWFDNYSQRCSCMYSIEIWSRVRNRKSLNQSSGEFCSAGKHSKNTMHELLASLKNQFYEKLLIDSPERERKERAKRERNDKWWNKAYDIMKYMYLNKRNFTVELHVYMVKRLHEKVVIRRNLYIILRLRWIMCKCTNEIQL